MSVERMSVDELNIPLPGENEVKVIRAGDITHIVHDGTKRPGTKPVCKKISADQYVDIRTGEVHDYKHAENRGESIESLKRSMERIRQLIDSNTAESNGYRWLTLTYRENMCDLERVYSDFKKFNMRLRRKIGHYEYIAVCEPQERGAWHLHVLMIWHDQEAPYIPPWIISGAWQNGYIKIKAVNEVRDIGAYITSYLSDLYHPESKSSSKNARLYLYPPGCNIVRYSRGIKKPQIAKEKLSEAMESLSDSKLRYQRGYKVSDQAGNPIGKVIHKQYIKNGK